MPRCHWLVFLGKTGSGLFIEYIVDSRGYSKSMLHIGAPFYTVPYKQRVLGLKPAQQIKPSNSSNYSNFTLSSSLKQAPATQHTQRSSVHRLSFSPVSQTPTVKNRHAAHCFRFVGRDHAVTRFCVQEQLAAQIRTKLSFSRCLCTK